MFSSGRQKHDIKQLMLYIAIHTIYIRIDFLLITRTPLGVYLFQINKLYFNTRIYRIIFINVIGTIPNLIFKHHVIGNKFIFSRVELSYWLGERRQQFGFRIIDGY
jgi:hypothetical protein